MKKNGSPTYTNEQIMSFIKEGYGGILSTGTIVDRRDYPNAMPFQENELLGTPDPKTLTPTASDNKVE